MRRVLLITNTFPPLAGNSSEKMGTRVKFLYQYGWKTTVLTPELPSPDEADKGLLENLPPIEVHRTSYLFNESLPSIKNTRGIFLTKNRKSWLDYIYLPNGYIRWLPYAVRAGRKLAADVDVILSFNNPTMMHLIAYLVSRLTGKPWVAGLRDPISGYHFNRRGPELFNRFIERLVARSADRVVQWGDFVVEPMAERHPDLPSEKFVVIPFTGYNAEDFTDVHSLPQNVTKPLKIAYTGSFYTSSITPEPLLRALGYLVRQRQIAPTDIEVTFAGDWDEAYTELVESLNLSHMVRYLGFISRHACLELWSKSHVLLVILGENFDSIHRFPAKFWEYVGARRYILALVPVNGRLAELVRQQKLGMVAPPHDEAKIAEALMQLLAQLEQGQLQPQPTEKFLTEEASRAFGEKRLAEILEQTCRCED